MFDMEYLTTLAMPMVIAACLILGYIIKMWVKDVDNKFIPTILAVFGAVIACVVKQDITVEVIVGGAFSGLASTGLHQAFKQLLGGGDEE